MIPILAALVIFQTAPTRLTMPLRVLQIDPQAVISLVGSHMSRKLWGSVIVGPKDKLDKELDRLVHAGQAKQIDSHKGEVYATEPLLWSVTKNRDSLDVRVTVSKPGPPADLTVSWRFTGGPGLENTDLHLNPQDEALLTEYAANGQKLMLVVSIQ